MKKKTWNPDKFTDLIQREAVRRRRPLSCMLELTYRCNFHCRMCYIRMSDAQAKPYGRMRTVEEWTDMAHQLYDAGVHYLTLTGGECTLYPGFEELYTRLIKMGFCITVMSNAGSYTESIQDLFRRFPSAFVAITLYGGCNQTYEAVTGDPAGFEKTVENIRFFQSIKVPVSLNFTMIKQNIADYPLVNKLSQELGIPYTLLTDITGHCFDSAFSNALECRLSPAERCYVACNKPEEAAHALEKSSGLEKELQDFRMPTASDESNSTILDDCVGSYSACAIYWNGDMQTCISMRNYRCVKPFETGFEAAWKQLKEQHAETFRRPAACQACTMQEDCIHNCAGRRVEGIGSTIDPDPYTCQYVYLLNRHRAGDQTHELPDDPSCV